MERQNVLIFTKYTEEEIKERLEVEIEEKMKAYERNNVDCRAKKYFLDTVMEKLKYPEKQYQEILEEMYSRAARTQGFYQYVAGLSQLVIDERMLAAETKKVINKLDALAEGLIDELEPVSKQEKANLYLKKILMEKGIKGDKAKKLFEVTWKVVEEPDIKIEDALVRVMPTWKIAQIEQYLGVELDDTESFKCFIENIIEEVKTYMKIDEMLEENNQKLSYESKELFFQAMMEKMSRPQETSFRRCIRIYQKNVNKYKFKSINAVVIKLHQITEKIEGEKVKDTSNLCKVLQSIESQLTKINSILPTYSIL